MKTLKFIAFCMLSIPVIQSCSKKETFNTPSAAFKLNGRTHVDSWTLGQPLTNGVYSFQNPNGNTFQGDSKNVGSLVQAYTNATGWPPQEWEVTCLGDVYGVPIYSIINHYSGLALGVVSSSTSQNAQIDQETYTQAGNQIWGITIIAWGQYYIWNTHSGMALVIPGDATTQGTDLVQQTYANPNVSAQDWQPALITQSDSVTVNFAASTGSMNHTATGFLNTAFAGTDSLTMVSPMTPSNADITPLHVHALRVATDVTPTYHRSYGVVVPAVAALGINVEVVIDNWPVDGGNNLPNNNWASYDTVVQNVAKNINRVYPGGVAANPTKVSFDLWNEPDEAYQFGTGTYWNDFLAAWQRAYNDIKGVYPNATIVGPSFGNFNSTNLSSFLTYCKANNCVPNYVSWHFSSNIAADITTAEGVLSSVGITFSPGSAPTAGTVSGFEENEYNNADYYNSKNVWSIAPWDNAAESAWYIAQLDRAQVDQAGHANVLHAAMRSIWADAYYGALGGLLGSSQQNFQTRATWYAYKGYGDINANASTLKTTAGTFADIVAGNNAPTGTNNVIMLVGANSNQGNSYMPVGTVQVTCNTVGNLSMFQGRTTVTIKVIDIPDNNTEFITSSNLGTNIETVPVVNGTVRIYIPYNNNRDAYEITMY